MTEKRKLKSPKGVYYDIKDSDYMVSNGQLIFFFSSESNMQKFFKKQNEDKTVKINHLLKSFKQISPSFDLLLDIEFYKTHEKKGFYVLNKNKEVSEKDLLKLAAESVAKENNETKDYFIVKDIDQLKEIIS